MAITDEDINALQKYMLWDDIGFEACTEGPRHRGLLKDIMCDKKVNVLIREKLIANYLGLEHNSKMHSTTDGITTYDAVKLLSGRCFEIKAEQHTRNNADRASDRCQITGTGVFGGVTDLAAINKLILDNPRIAHGMFLDGRLLAIVTFDFSSSGAADRISRYCLGDTKTAPRYTFTDWIDAPGLIVEYISPNWPSNLYSKYRKLLRKKYNQQLQPVVISLPIQIIVSTESLPDQHLSV